MPPELWPVGRVISYSVELPRTHGMVGARDLDKNYWIRLRTNAQDRSYYKSVKTALKANHWQEGHTAVVTGVALRDPSRAAREPTGR